MGAVVKCFNSTLNWSDRIGRRKKRYRTYEFGWLCVDKTVKPGYKNKSTRCIEIIVSSTYRTNPKISAWSLRSEISSDLIRPENTSTGIVKATHSSVCSEFRRSRFSSGQCPWKSVWQQRNKIIYRKLQDKFFETVPNFRGWELFFEQSKYIFLPLSQ